MYKYLKRFFNIINIIKNFSKIIIFLLKSLDSKQCPVNYLHVFRVWGHSSAGRALEWHSRGQGFDPPCLQNFLILLSTLINYILSII